MSPDQADTLFRHIDRASSLLNWWIGDIALAAMGQVRAGDDALAAVDFPSDQPNTARCVHVADKVPPERRRGDLTWSHHAEVAGHNPQDQARLLAHAADNSLSVRALRAVITQEREDLEPRLDLPEPPVLPRPPVSALRAAWDAVGPHGGVVWAFDGEIIALSAAEVEAVLAERRRRAA